MKRLASTSIVREELRSLFFQWERLGLHWTDAQYRRVGDQFIEPAMTKLQSIEPAVHEMNQILAKIQQECGWE